MTLEAKALEQYKQSDGYKTNIEHENLQLPYRQKKYLRNRIESAFLDGVQYGKEIAAQRIRDVIEGETV